MDDLVLQHLHFGLVKNLNCLFDLLVRVLLMDFVLDNFFCFLFGFFPDFLLNLVFVFIDKVPNKVKKSPSELLGFGAVD